MTHWECNECDYQIEGSEPPEVCPLCGEPRQSFTLVHPINMDGLDRKLLNLIQASVPLQERPFAILGRQLNLAEEDVIARVRRLKAAAIRQVSAIFDSRSLGYQSTLVAFELPDDRVDAGAAVVTRHPGVSHNYRRDHRFNLWFTLTLHRSMSLMTDVEALAAASGARRYLILPTLRLFKIGVQLDATGNEDPMRQEQGEIVHGFRAPQTLTPDEKQAVRVLQRDLPLVERPFLELAERFGDGLTQAELFGYAERFLDRGIMRRYSAVLRHRNAGFGANAMGVWVVPEDRMEDVGNRIARYAAVSHCYQRPAYPPDWPYNLFSMVHGRTVEEAGSILDAVSREVGITQYDKLYSTREYKKVRVKYFTWESTTA